MNTNNDKLVLVKGWDESELRQIINDFIASYEEDDYPAYTIESHKQSENLYRLTFPQDIHPTLFTFLINYLAYPLDLDATNAITVAGKTTLTSDFAIDAQHAGQKALLYIPENDQDHDVVYLQTESGVAFAHSFSEMEWRRVADARLSSEVKGLVK